MDLNQQCHYDGRFTVSWGYQFSYTSIFGGPTGNRTPTRGLQSHCAPVITISPNFLATPKGFEPLTFGFGDQRSAGLNYGAMLWWRISDLNRSPPACKAGALPDELIPQISNTLLPMCVLKHSTWMNPLVPSRVENALIRSTFTNCVVATVFSSSRPPTL